MTALESIAAIRVRAARSAPLVPTPGASCVMRVDDVGLLCDVATAAARLADTGWYTNVEGDMECIECGAYLPDHADDCPALALDAALAALAGEP